MDKIKIKEIIVVEGKDDVSAVKKAVDAQIITTGGYSLNKNARDLIKRAALRENIIILTDSDYAGETIRKRVEKLAGKDRCLHAFVPRDSSTKDGDIGIENASADSIIQALLKVRKRRDTKLKEEFSTSDMIKNNLTACENSSEKRDFVGKYLGIGYANAKQFLSRLNSFDITREEFTEAVQAYENKDK